MEEATRTPTHLHPPPSTSARAARPLRWLLDITTPVPSLTTVRRSVGEATVKDSWAMEEATRTPTHLHPPPSTSAVAERPSRCLLEFSAPVPSLTTVRRSVGDMTTTDGWAMEDATRTPMHHHPRRSTPAVAER